MTRWQGIVALDPHVSEEPVFVWLKREWLLVLITVGIGIDWLPFMLTPYVPQFGPLSGTRLLVMPGLLLAGLLTPSWITRPHVLAVAYLVTILIGGGLGWFAGTVPLGRVNTLLVNGVILAYYLSLRSLVSIRRVLAITFVLSIGVPIIQCLAALGVITPEWLTDVGALPDPDGRIFSIFDTTTPGFVPLIIPACLGGLLFLHARSRRTFVNAVLAAGLVGFGLTSALLARQRSGVLAYAVSLSIALVLYVSWQRKRVAWLLVGFGLLSLVAANLGQQLVTPAAERFGNAALYEDQRDLRLLGLSTFLSDFADNPLNLVPIGQDSLLDRTGIAPHFLVSEAYYSGGPLFLAAIVAILLRFAEACLALARSSDANARLIGNCLCAFGAGAAVEVMLQTSLGLRIVPLIVGVAIAGHRVRRAQVRRAALAGLTWQRADAH
jgi:hypothetical protein